jgi:hypothetical protein
MIHLQWETTTSPERDAASSAGDAVSPEGDLLASPNFGICDTTSPLSTKNVSCSSFSRYKTYSAYIINIKM